MSLEAASYDSARWWPWCDGRMVIDIGVTVPYGSCQDVRAALFSGSTALSEWRMEYKRFPKKKLTPIRLVRKQRRASHPILRSKRYNKYMHMECENITR